MAKIRNVDLDVILDEAKKVDYNFPAKRLSEFAGDALNRCPMQVFSDNELARIAAKLTRHRADELLKRGQVPSFVINKDALSNPLISGLGSFLNSKNASTKTLSRLERRAEIRDALRSLHTGHLLEAVAAAILDSHLDRAFATRGSGDRGIDAVGWSILFELNEAFVEEDNRVQYAPDAKVFAFVSAKKSMSNGSTLSLISPAMIRELIGGWVIQRSTIGGWADEGVKMLSPVQMIFATTYRLSTAARSDCRRLGVQIWALPELVSLVAQHAPDNVFDSNNGYAMSLANFENWYLAYHNSRVAPN